MIRIGPRALSNLLESPTVHDRPTKNAIFRLEMRQRFGMDALLICVPEMNMPSTMAKVVLIRPGASVMEVGVATVSGPETTLPTTCLAFAFFRGGMAWTTWFNPFNPQLNLNLTGTPAKVNPTLAIAFKLCKNATNMQALSANLEAFHARQRFPSNSNYAFSC